MKNLFNTITALLTISGLLFTINSCKKKIDDTPPINKTTPSLLKNAQKGRPFTTGFIADFVLAQENGQVLLLGANNTTGAVYAIDLKDNDAASATNNAITSDVGNFGTLLVQTLGVASNQISILNMEVNPISKSVYLLVFINSSNTSVIVKASNKGSTLTVVDLSNVDYVSMPFSIIGERVNDLTWGDGSLYISYSHPSTLVGKIATAKSPFEHNFAMLDRYTTVFKTNWGDAYYTNAPLETMCYGEVAGVKRLMGVTVCAPGFSFKTSDITTGTGLLQVKEYFNLNTGSALKVYPVTNGGKTYLIEHHFNGRITRVGEKYLNESQQSNANAKYLLQMNGNVDAGLTNEDARIIASTGYLMSALNSDSKIIAFGNDGSLTLLDL